MRSPTTLFPIGPGTDLLEALAELARAGEGWIDGTGYVEGVELRVAGEGTDPVRAVRGRFTLVQLSGPTGGPYSATLARASEAGIEMRGGVLVRARSAGVTVAFHASAAPAPVARPLRGEVRAADKPEVPDAAARAVAPPQPMWARVAAANAAAAERDTEDEVEALTPEAGDMVDHFAFGICEILTADGDRLRIRDVQGPGRIREVSLDMLTVMSPAAADGGKRLFRLVRKTR